MKTEMYFNHVNLRNDEVSSSFIPPNTVFIIFNEFMFVLRPKICRTAVRFTTV